MPAALTTLLVQASELRDYDAETVRKIKDDDDFALQMCLAAQDILEGFLGFNPFAHPETIYVVGSEARRIATSAGSKWYMWPRGPVFEGGTTLSILEEEDVQRLVFTSTGVNDTYYSGWRRADMELDELQALVFPPDSGTLPLSAITLLPDIVPSKIITCICELGIYMGARAETNLGRNQVAQDLGTPNTTVQVTPLRKLTKQQQTEVDGILETYAGRDAVLVL